MSDCEKDEVNIARVNWGVEKKYGLWCDLRTFVSGEAVNDNAAPSLNWLRGAWLLSPSPDANFQVLRIAEDPVSTFLKFLNLNEGFEDLTSSDERE